MNNNIPAVGYVRCSTEQQEDSPEQQKKAILEFASKNGFSILEWFTDFGKSGTNFEQRLEFQRLRQVVEGTPPFQAVVCYDESRWGRPIDPEESTYWRFYFRQRGVDVVLVKTSIDPNNEFAPMMKSFEGIQASQYSKKLSELVLRGGLNNKGYSNGGSAPYGYKRIAVNLRDGSQRELLDAQWSVHKQEKVKLALGNPEEVEIVQLIFKLRLQGKAYALIAEALNLRGVSCPKRGRSRNQDQKWSSTTVNRILDNPVYYGASVYNRVSTSKIIARHKGLTINRDARKQVSRNPAEEWSTEENAHPEIVSYETWKQVNETNRREYGVKRNQHVLKSTYLLSGLMKCSVCGYPFQGWSITKNMHKYTRYLCSGHEKKRVCEACSFKAQPLEEFAIRAVRETLNETLLSGKIAEYLEKLMDVDPRQQEVIKSRVKQALEENDRKKKNLADAISLSANAKAIATLVEKLEQLEAEAESLKKQSLLEQKVEAIELEMEFQASAVKQFIEQFEHAIRNSTEDVKKTILRKCISGVLVDREAKKFKFDIRKVPAVTPELERRYAIRKPLSITLANVMSANTFGGAQWTLFDGVTSNSLYSVYFTDVNNGWIAGEYGTILHTTDGGITFVQSDSNPRVPNHFELLHNYPNPFNSSTTISYSLPQSSSIDLKLFDVTGRELSTIFHGFQQPGTHRLNFDGASLSSGTYFVRMQANSFQQTQKMILLK